MKAFKKFSLFENDEETIENTEDEFYEVSEEDAKNGKNSNKMILVEPRAYSESQTIADHLKSRNSVVVNFKRVTSDQQKRIIDFLSGTLYAIGGDLQKIGKGIYLCTPKNMDVQGAITEEEKEESSEEDW